MSFTGTLEHYQKIIHHSLAFSLPSYFARYESTTPWTQSLQDYVLGGGKRLRPILAMMYAKVLGYNIDEYLPIFNALEVFHDFILAHDDIVDQDGMRRGYPTIHTRLQTAYRHLYIHDREHFGKSLAMIGGDVLHAMAQSYILDADIDDSRKVLLIRTMNEAMLDVAWGRYKQFLSDSMKIADVSLDYIFEYNLRQVTGSYTFLFPLRFGHVIALGTMDIDPLIVRLCRYVGILFQTGDDLMGLFGDPAITGKSNFGDIIQAKKTIPIYYSYHHAPSSQQQLLQQYLGKVDLTLQEAEIVRDIVRTWGLQATYDVMNEYAAKSLTVIDQLGYDQEYLQWRKEGIQYLLTRTY